MILPEWLMIPFHEEEKVERRGAIPMLENKSDLFYCSELIFE